jgi:uncharacterized protein
MKILAVSDHIDPLVYSAGIKNRFADVDLVLSAGDLPMEYLGFISASLNKPIFFVFGNHHLKHLSRFRQWGVQGDLHRYRISDTGIGDNYFGSTYVGARVVRHENLIIAGIGGCKRYNRGENQFTEFQMLRLMLKMAPRLLFNAVFHGRALDILLTHAAPYRVNDRPDPTHEGFKVLRWFLRTFKPQYMLHGHIHLYDLNTEREVMYEKTRVINVYDHFVLDFDAESQ